MFLNPFTDICYHHLLPSLEIGGLLSEGRLKLIEDGSERHEADGSERHEAGHQEHCNQSHHTGCWYVNHIYPFINVTYGNST